MGPGVCGPWPLARDQAGQHGLRPPSCGSESASKSESPARRRCRRRGKPTARRLPPSEAPWCWPRRTAWQAVPVNQFPCTARRNGPRAIKFRAAAMSWVGLNGARRRWRLVADPSERAVIVRNAIRCDPRSNPGPHGRGACRLDSGDHLSELVLTSTTWRARRPARSSIDVLSEEVDGETVLIPE